MINKNEEYDVNIIANGINGEGICKIDDFTIFVDGALEGEKCRIKIVKVNSHFGYGKLLEIIEKSIHRAIPDCMSYKRCGGCEYRHSDYEYTLEIKQQKVQNLMNKELESEILVEPTLGMNSPLYYRNKAIYPVSIDENGKPFIGIFAPRSHNVIKFEDCKIQSKISQDIAKFIIDNWKGTIYNELTGNGLLRNIMVRVGFNTNEVMVTLVENGIKDYDYKPLVNKFPEIKTILINDNHINTNVVLSTENKVIYGPGYIIDKLGDYKFQISVNSFYQVNTLQTENLYNIAIDMAELKRSDEIFDLYCGIGTIGIFASKYVNKVHGIEIVHSSIENAKENAKLNNIDNIDFVEGDVKYAFENAVQNGQKMDVVFVDPPRKGLDETTIINLKKVKPRKIVYVSCNPATLARDLHKMENEYLIKRIKSVDNFPYTSHVECVTLLCLKDNI